MIDSGSGTVALSPRDEAELLDAIHRHPVLGLELLRARLLERSYARAGIESGGRP